MVCTTGAVVRHGRSTARPPSFCVRTGGIAFRTAADHRRWHKVRRTNQWVVEALYQERPRDGASPGSDLERSRLERRVAEVLERMSPKLCSVIVLCDIEEVDIGQVAAVLDIPLNTVRSRRRLARESFEKLWREILEELGEP